jgi:DNA polymerase I
VRPQLWSAQQYHKNLLAPVGRAVLQMERTGIPVDIGELKDIQARMDVAGKEQRAKLLDWTQGVEINWNSWQQLAKFLHGDGPGELNLEPSPYCKKGEVADDKISTDDRALEWLAGHNPDQRDAIQTLRQLRTVERMARYARDWEASAVPHPDGTHRLHPSFGLASDHDTRPGAKTGRFGVKNPALNQVPTNTEATGDLGIPKDPAKVKKAFVAPPGMRLIVVDYSQLEIVILAHLIALLFGDQDPLVQRVRAGKDIHGPLARTIFGKLAGDPEVAAAVDADFKKVPKLKMLRNLAKAFIYGNNYGKGERGFGTSVFLPTGEVLGEERAKLGVMGMREEFPGTFLYQDHIREIITSEGHIMSLFGRVQPLPNARHPKQGMRNRAWRQALNYPMQASGQEIMALALIAAMRDEVLRKLGFVLSLVVHDEIVGFAPEDRADEARVRLEEIMVTSVELLAPLKAEGKTGANWREAK